MKSLCVLFALITFTSASYQLHKIIYMPSLLNKYLVAIINKDYNNLELDKICPNHPDGFRRAVAQASACLRKLSGDLDGEIEEDQSVCDTLATKTPTCLDPVVKNVDGCASKENSAVLRFMQEVIGSVELYKCRSTGNQILELYNPCLTEETDETRKLERQLQEYFNRTVETERLSAKELMCRRLMEDKLLAESHVQITCPSDFTRRSVMRFVGAVFKPCEDDNN